jgi:hypothetical protein
VCSIKAALVLCSRIAAEMPLIPVPVDAASADLTKKLDPAAAAVLQREPFLAMAHYTVIPCNRYASLWDSSILLHDAPLPSRGDEPAGPL